MRRTFYAFASIALLTTAIGCGGDTYDKVAGDMVKNMQQLRDQLKTVTDKPSSTAAALQINGLATDIRDVKQRLNTLGKPSKEVGDQLNSKYANDMTQTGKDIAAELQRIHALGPDIAAPVEAAVENAMQLSRPTTNP